MADWYVSSVAYAAIPAWQATTAYTVGQIIRPVAAGATAQHPFRCTTAGTTASSEPGWSAGLGNIVTSGTAQFTNIGGSSTYGWSGAAGTLRSIDQNRTDLGDRIFLSSDHSEDINTYYVPGGHSAGGYGLVQIISVNRAGSVPPTASDIQNGAAISNTAGSLALDAICNLFWQGITFTAGAGNINLNGVSGTATKAMYFKDCAFVLTSSTTVYRPTNTVFNCRVTLDNVTMQFGSVSQRVGLISNGATMDLTWINTPNALAGATVPTAWFGNTSASFVSFLATCRGVDLSAVARLFEATTCWGGSKILLDSCKLNSDYWPGFSEAMDYLPTTVPTTDELELVNCFDGTNIVNERHTYAGSVTTDTGVAMFGGGRDNIGTFAHKLSSSRFSDISAMPLESFWLDYENTLIGSALTAMVEILSNISLNDNDIKLVLEYMDTSGSPVADFLESMSSVLASASALPSSTAAWSTSGFTTLNPFDYEDITFSNHNLTATAQTIITGARAFTCLSSGKYYWEASPDIINNTIGIGMMPVDVRPSSSGSLGWYLNLTDGIVQVLGSTVGVTLGGVSAGGVIGVAVDLTNQMAWVRIAPSGNWNGSGTANPATNTGGFSLASFSGLTMAPSVYIHVGADKATMNFGASAFSGSVPSGFTAGVPKVGSNPVKQKLQVTFTPQVVGRVRARVVLGKTATTVWVNPQLIMTQ